MKGEGRSDNGTGARDICRRTFEFAVDVVDLCKRLEKASGVWRTLGRQLLRSGVSTGANVEEARGGQSRADFICKYAIARKEARETLYWLRLHRATGSASQDGLEHLTDEADQLVRILTAIIKSAEHVRLLLKHGADPHAEDEEGKTPLEIVRETGRRYMIDTLEKAAESTAAE